MSNALADVLPSLKRAFREGGQEALLKLPGLGETFHFAPSFPLVNVRVPLQDLADAIPAGQNAREYLDSFDSLLDAEAKGDRSHIRLPSGATEAQLSRAWEEVNLFSDSGAIAYRKIQFSKELAKVVIEARGLNDVLLVVSEDGKIIVGLDYFWALSELEEYQTAPVVVLYDAPFNAGFLYLESQEREDQASFRSNRQFQEELKSASDDERRAFQKLGFTYIPERVTLTCSAETLDRLGTLIRKQLGYGTKFDPAQLLYVEALREGVLAFRKRMIAEGNSKGGMVEKLSLHESEEREALKRGAKLSEKNNWRWTTESDGAFVHPALPRYRFVVQESEGAAEPAETAPVKSDYLMTESQFVLLARTHFGLGREEAKRLRDSESAQAFNLRLRRYTDKAPEVSPNHAGPSSNEERASQEERLALWSS